MDHPQFTPTPAHQQEAAALGLGGDWFARLPDILDFIAGLLRGGFLSGQLQQQQAAALGLSGDWWTKLPGILRFVADLIESGFGGIFAAPKPAVQ